MTMVMMTAMTIAMMMTTAMVLVMMMTTIKSPGIGVGNQHQIHRLPVLGTTRNWSVTIIDIFAT